MTTKAKVLPRTLAECQTVQAVATMRHPVQSIRIDLERLPELAEAVEAVLPNCYSRPSVIKDNGVNSTGQNIILYCVKQDRPTKGSVTVYATGSALFCGIPPIVLQ